MAYPGQEGHSDRGRGELSVWVQVIMVGSGAGTHGGGDTKQARLGALCALTSGTCTKRLSALPCAVQMSAPGPLLSGHSNVPPSLSLGVLAPGACQVSVVTCLFVCLFVSQVGLALL